MHSVFIDCDFVSFLEPSQQRAVLNLIFGDASVVDDSVANKPKITEDIVFQVVAGDAQLSSDFCSESVLPELVDRNNRHSTEKQCIFSVLSVSMFQLPLRYLMLHNGAGFVGIAFPVEESQII